MAIRRIHASPEGDTWDLSRDDATGRVSVVHTASPASGGAVSDFDVDAFLPRTRGSAEHVALVRMIGTLVAP